MKPRILCLFILAFFATVATSQKSPGRPNIIYIMADDLGYADLSCYGRKDYQTPFLDKLCTQGVKFLNAYAAAPVCTPTRTAFYTGRYPARTQVGLYEPITEVPKDSVAGLSPETPSIATLLKNAGYETFLVGKWHMGFTSKYSPYNNGFDHFFGFKMGATDYLMHSSPSGKPDLYEDEKPVVKDGYITDLIAEKSLEWIAAKHDKPFFMAVMFNAPHWPWQAAVDKPISSGTVEDWKKGGSAETYASMVKSMDSAIGRILNKLDELKLADNTVIIFTSDNGGEKFSDNGIYKGRKYQLWEGGIREPAIIRWPGQIPANSTSEQVVTTMDWTATILSLGGAKAHPAFPLDGIDILPIIQGKKPKVDRTLYWRLHQRISKKAIRDSDWKWLQDEKGNEYLFDLKNDPSEMVDLKDKFPDVLSRLKSMYSKWEGTVLKPITL